VESIFGLRAEEQHHSHAKHKPKIIVLGMNSMSAEAIETIHGKKSLLLIEKDPRKVLVHKERGVQVLCTDAFNQDIYDELVDFSDVETAISVADDASANMYFVRKIRELKKDANIIVIAPTEDVGKKLYKAGATLVLQPDVIGRRLLSDLLLQPEKVRAVGREYYAELGKSFVYQRI
jgi:Trk K+ transport system NAD-binding subunit